MGFWKNSLEQKKPKKFEKCNDRNIYDDFDLLDIRRNKLTDELKGRYNSIRWGDRNY